MHVHMKSCRCLLNLLDSSVGLDTKLGRGPGARDDYAPSVYQRLQSQIGGAPGLTLAKIGTKSCLASHTGLTRTQPRQVLLEVSQVARRGCVE